MSSFKSRRIRAPVWLLTLDRKPRLSRGRRLRLTLEQLGPIFVEFEQVLSTRRDLLPPDVTDELIELQGCTPPFDPKMTTAIVGRLLGKSLSALFHRFDHHPVASALIVQVHFTMLCGGPYNGRKVAVKVLRPGMLPVIDSDLVLMRNLTTWIEKLWTGVRHLRPHGVVAEFDKYLHDELDPTREAASASQLRHNFAESDLLLVLEVFWD